MEGRARHALDMIATISARAGGKAINLWVFLLLARTLPLDELGMYGFAYSTAIILASAFDLGVRNSVAYYIGREQKLTATYAVQAVRLWLIACVPNSLVFWLILERSMPGLTTSQLTAPCLLLGASYLFVRMMQGVLLGDGRIHSYNASELASRVVLLAGTIACLLAGVLNLQTALWTLALATTAAAIVLITRLFAYMRIGSWRNTLQAQQLIVRGFQFMIAVLLMSLAKRICFLVLGHLGTEAQTGTFYGYMRLTEVITEIGLAVAVVVFSNNVRSASTAEAVDNAALSTRLAVAVFSMLTVIGLLTASWLLPAFLGEGFSSGLGVFRIALVGTLIGSIWTILFPSLSAILPPLTTARVFAPSVIIGFALSWLMHNWWGLSGIAWAYLLTNAVLSGSFLAMYRARFGVPIRSFLMVRSEDVLPPLGQVWSRLGVPVLSSLRTALQRSDS